jgi:hypothetical protein
MASVICLNSAPVKPLSASRIWPAKEVVIAVSQRGEYLAFAEFGVGQTPHDRIPSPEQTR